MSSLHTFTPKLSVITPKIGSSSNELKSNSLQKLSTFRFNKMSPIRPSENEISPYNISNSHIFNEKPSANLISQSRKARYSTTLSAQTHNSILSIYEKDSLKKEQEYIRSLQKEKVSFSHNEDFEIIKEILRKPQKQRTTHEAIFLKKAFEPLQYFLDLKENIDENSYGELFSNLKFEATLKNKFVFKIGDIGSNIYLILKGEVSIFMSNPKENENNREKSKTHRNSNKIEKDLGLDKPPTLKSSTMRERNKKSISEYSLHSSEILIPDLTFVRKHGVGEVFGDGSVNNQGQRKASAFSNENCVFATLSSKLLKTYFEKKISEKIDLLRTIPIFKNVSTSYLQPLLAHCHELHFQKGNIIYKAGAPPEYFYFVKEGDIEISKLLKQKKISCEEACKPLHSIPDVLSFLTYNDIIESGSISLSMKEHPVECPISLISKGQYFGEKELLTATPRDEKAVCKSRMCILFAFPREKLLESLKNLTTKKDLNNLFKDKTLWESHSYQKNILKKQTIKTLKFFDWKRRKSKSCDFAFNLESAIGMSLLKAPKDLTVRKSDYDKDNLTKAFLNNIDSIHSKIKQLSIESKLPQQQENNITTARIKKEENLMNLFAPTSCYRTDLMVKMEEITKKQQNTAKPRVKTLSSYIKTRDDTDKNHKFKGDFEEKINSAILYRTLKCDKLIPNEKKIKHFAIFFNKIQKKFQEKAKPKSALSKKRDIVSPNKKKEASKRDDDFLFNFVGI